MTERAQNADFRRKPQIFADSPLLLEVRAFGGRRKPQKTTDFRRKPKIFAENRRKPQIRLRHLRSVTFCSSLVPSEPLSDFPRVAFLHVKVTVDAAKYEIYTEKFVGEHFFQNVTCSFADLPPIRINFQKK